MDTNNTRTRIHRSAFADLFLDPLADALNQATVEHGRSPSGMAAASQARAYFGLVLEREISRHVLAGGTDGNPTAQTGVVGCVS